MMKKIFSLLSAAVLTVTTIAQTNPNLKLNLEKGKTYRFTSSSEQTIVQTINGNPQTVESTSGTTISVKMIDSTPAFMIAEVHVDTMKSRSNAMGKITVMTSSVEKDIKSADLSDVVGCIMNRLTKNAVYAKIDYSGKPIEVINGKMLSDMILKDTSTITLTGASRAAVKNQAVEMISENALKITIDNFTGFLPGKAVVKGDAWEKTNSMISGGMSLEIKTTFKLEGISGNSATVTAESEIKPAANAKPIQSNGATVTYDNLLGLGKSTIVLDTSTGLVVEEKGKMHITGNLGISAPGFSMQMPMDINGTTTISAVK